MAVLAVVLLAAACAAAQRPTLTTDRIPDSVAEPAESAATTSEFERDAAELDLDSDQDTTDQNSAVPETATNQPGAVEQLGVEVLDTFPHDADAFTQGLELRDGLFLESTGLYGESDLRRVIPETGEVVELVPLASEFFAEGLTQVGDELIQLTWRENTALFYDADTFEPLREVEYNGEGWGLCFDGSQLVMTDGTPELIFRDSVTFDETARVPVTLNGEPVFNLNETECVGGEVWANIWRTTQIVRIDPATGIVNGVVDAQSLLQASGAAGNGNAVLNGIAWDETTSTFFVTGKLWPTMFRVNFVPAS